MTEIVLTKPPKSDCDYVYECLRRDIMSGRIRPHEHIVETAYAQQLGVSRTPIREALRLLERDGLVEFQSKRGAMVRELLTEEEVREIFHLQKLLNIDSAEATVRNVTCAELSAMAGCNDACATAIDEEDAEAFFYHYDRFNRILQQSSRRPFSIKLMEYLENFIPLSTTDISMGERSDVWARAGALDNWKARRQALREHMALWEALNDRDLGAYNKALKRHIGNRNEACIDD